MSQKLGPEAALKPCSAHLDLALVIADQALERCVAALIPGTNRQGRRLQAARHWFEPCTHQATAFMELADRSVLRISRR